MGLGFDTLALIAEWKDPPPITSKPPIPNHQPRPLVVRFLPPSLERGSFFRPTVKRTTGALVSPLFLEGFSLKPTRVLLSGTYLEINPVRRRHGTQVTRWMPSTLPRRASDRPRKAGWIKQVSGAQNPMGIFGVLLVGLGCIVRVVSTLIAILVELRLDQERFLLGKRDRGSNLLPWVHGRSQPLGCPANQMTRSQ